jgi:F420-dependent oxidoreductase-like protein
MDLVGIPVEEQWSAMLGVAQRIEAAGYESLWVYDHFHTVPEPTQEPTYECWTLMAAYATVTETIRLGQMCTCNSYRPPSYLAKVASSIDVISGGRLEFAIGAGWYEHEYLAYGYPFPKPSVRIGQLAEAVKIIKAMWTEDEARFAGKYYRVDGAINQPKPLQKPHPPLWIAGGGEKLTLRLAAEEADYTNWAGRVENFVRKGKILEAHCEAVGRDPAEITRSLIVQMLVDPDEASIERAAGQIPSFRTEAMSTYGSAEKVIDRLGEYKEAGCEYFIVYFPDAVWGDSIERFAAEVIPAFR